MISSTVMKTIYAMRLQLRVKIESTHFVHQEVPNTPNLQETIYLGLEM